MSIISLIFPVQGYGESVDLHIIKSDLSPMPTEPGKELVLSVIIENRGAEDAKNISIEINPDPIIIIKNKDKQYTTKFLCAHCTLSETYYLHIDSSAVSGIYRIEIKAHQDGEGTSKTIEIMVRGKPQLTISDVSIKPEIISPGSSFNLNFSIFNSGTGIAGAIKVTSQIDNLPFISIGSNTRVIEEIAPGNSKKIEYSLLVKEDAKPGSYSIPFGMDHQSEDGRNFSSSELIGINVLGTGKLNIAGINTDPSRIEKGNYITLTIRIENAGKGDAKSVKASIDIPFKGTKTAFLGKIEPDNDAPAIFNLQADDSGELRYNLTIQYEDDVGKHDINEELMMAVSSDNRTSIFIVLLFLLVAAVVAYRYFIRRK